MKKSTNFFNNEERNGVFLLSSLLIVFSIFIFLQKRVLPSNSSIHVSLNELINDNEEAVNMVHSMNTSFASLNHSKEKQKKQYVNKKLPTKTISKVYSDRKEVKEYKSQKPQFAAKVAKETPEKPRLANKVQKDIKKAFQTNKKWKKTWKPKKIKPFSLNSTSQEEWKQINGIGDGYSARIIKYQKWLGGFHSVNQLNEVYGLTDSLIQVIEPHLIISNDIKQIKINVAESKTLGRHPYLEWKEANVIVKYRKHHFPLTKEVFLAMEGVSSENKQRMLPYINFEYENLETEENEKVETKNKSKEATVITI